MHFEQRTRRFMAPAMAEVPEVVVRRGLTCATEGKWMREGEREKEGTEHDSAVTLSL